MVSSEVFPHWKTWSRDWDNYLDNSASCYRSWNGTYFTSSFFLPFFHPVWVIAAKESHSCFHAVYRMWHKVLRFFFFFFEVLAVFLKARPSPHAPFQSRTPLVTWASLLSLPFQGIHSLFPCLRFLLGWRRLHTTRTLSLFLRIRNPWVLKMPLLLSAAGGFQGVSCCCRHPLSTL